MGRRAAWADADREFADRPSPSHDGRVQRLEMPTIARFLSRKQPGGLRGSDRAVLKAALRKYRHLDPEYRADSARDHFTLQGVQELVRTGGQLGERNCFRHSDDRRTCVRAEAVELVGAGTRVAPHATAAKAAGIRE